MEAVLLFVDPTGFGHRSRRHAARPRPRLPRLGSPCSQRDFSPAFSSSSSGNRKHQIYRLVFSISVDPTGFEPATPSVQMRCSTK
ncbi:MAG: hypothetical protein RL094_566 [Candidatus Parcubacteria bacterium]